MSSKRLAPYLGFMGLVVKTSGGLLSHNVFQSTAHLQHMILPVMSPRALFGAENPDSLNHFSLLLCPRQPRRTICTASRSLRGTATRLSVSTMEFMS
jgi:hypothetical protein